MTDWPLRPLVPASLIPRRLRPVIRIPENKYIPLKENARQRADGGPGDQGNNECGVVGEYSLALFFGDEGLLDTEIYDKGEGDGGFDIDLGRTTLDIKTARQYQTEPGLAVSTGEPLRADYYVLANRLGPLCVELIGYCPRKFVANSPERRMFNGEEVHYVPQGDLFPFPFWI